MLNVSSGAWSEVKLIDTDRFNLQTYCNEGFMMDTSVAVISRRKQTLYESFAGITTFT